MAENLFNNLEWGVSSINVSLIKGEDSEKIFLLFKNEIQKIKEDFDWLYLPSHLDSLDYHKGSKETFGSDPFNSGLLNKFLLNSGLRTAVPSDDFNGEVSRLVRDNYYTDFNALVLWDKEPEEELNEFLWKRARELAENKLGRLSLDKKPIMIQGFYLEPSGLNESHYNVDIIPAKNFKVIEDERFLQKYGGWKFDDVDELGIPKNLNKNSGSRIFETMDNGLSRFLLTNQTNIYVSMDILGESYDDGRIILVKERS